MCRAFPEPTEPYESRSEILLGYLDFFRSVLVDKLRGLPEEDLRVSRLPSGWSPLELLKHVVHAERRWLVWRFAGDPVECPWADAPRGHWSVAAHEDLADLTRQLHEQAARTRAIVETHALSERGRPGEGWAGTTPATLERVLLHLLQEYARHAGHVGHRPRAHRRHRRGMKTHASRARGDQPSVGTSFGCRPASEAHTYPDPRAPFSPALRCSSRS